ncbi:MAG: amidase [Acetobacterales bacterium]
MTTKVGLHDLTVAEAGRLIAARRLSPVEYLDALLGRIEATEPSLHAFITVVRDGAAAQARDAEAEIAAGRRRGPLHGIPFGLKDNYETAGVLTTGNSRLFADHVPEADSHAARRLKEAGAILLGKMALDELAHGGPSADLPWPAVCNPWNTDCTAGGSSSGSAAAVAARQLPFCLGTDTGGSIRSPAGLCGIVGYKPTYGLVGRSRVIPNSFTFDHCGPMTRTVEDAAIVLGALAGHDPADPSSVPTDPADFAAGLPQDLKDMRIGVVRHFYEDDLPAPEHVRDTMNAAVAVFADLGAAVEDVSLRPLDDYAAVKMTIQLAEIYSVWEEELRDRPEVFGEVFRYRTLSGALVRGVDYVQAQRQRRLMQQEYAAQMRNFDAVITSGIYGPAPRIRKWDRKAKFSKPSITVGFSTLGVPAVSLPCGFTDDGMPLALQVAGKAFEDATVLRVAHAYERAAGWSGRRPHLGG